MNISIHPPRAGRDICCKCLCEYRGYFNPPAPCGAGRCKIIRAQKMMDFNPPAPCGAGLCTGRQLRRKFIISIHPPRAGRDGEYYISIDYGTIFQSTRPVRGGTITRFTAPPPLLISIHPPRAGRDCTFPHSVHRIKAISIHPPRAGRDQRCSSKELLHFHFNPPAPCGAGLQSCTKFIPCIFA